MLKVYDYFQNQIGDVYIITELCNGGNLGERLTKMRSEGKSFSIPEVIEILREIISGVHHLHQNSIVHRDLKTENIFINNNQYKLGDFGFAKKYNKQFTTVCGTPAYMAPEFYTHSPQTEIVDVWSIGIIAWE